MVYLYFCVSKATGITEVPVEEEPMEVQELPSQRTDETHSKLGKTEEMALPGSSGVVTQTGLLVCANKFPTSLDHYLWINDGTKRANLKSN